MERSLLVKVVGALDHRDKSRMEYFLTAEYFNSGKHAEGILNLWKILKNNQQGEQISDLTKEGVFQQLFPGEAFHLSQLEKLMSKLLNLIYQYIHSNANPIEEEDIRKQINVYRFLMKNGLLAAGQARSKQINRQLKAVSSNTGNFHLTLLYQKAISDFESLRNNRNADLNLPACLNSLDNYYLFYKLELTFQLLSVNQWLWPLDIKNFVLQLDKTLKEIPSALRIDPIFQLYHQAYLLLKNFETSDESGFHQFQQTLEDFQSHCHLAQLKAFQTLSRNYCIFSYKAGNISFITIGYDLYRKHLKEGLLYHQGKILVGAFCNLVLLANWKNDFAWAKRFIKNHKDKISGIDPAQEVCNFNLAVTAFYQKEYEKTLQLLAPNYQDKYLKFASKRLEIMALFDLKSDLLDHRLEAFKVFVYRLSLDNNLSKTKERNRNFVAILKQIKHPKTLDNPIRLQKILSKIEKTKHLMDRLWLLEKARQMR